MADQNDLNLDDEYQKIVENKEQPVEEPQNLGKVNMDRFKQDKAQDADVVLGYHDVNVSNLPSAGMFYPEKTEISIRSAKVAEIRHFSSIDENNILNE